MKKIKTFNIALTLAAFAALVFLLPADKDISTAAEKKAENSISQRSITTKANQQKPIKGTLLHSA